jgi:NADPH:quinone reductase-like Zn-dependent oxidoreductase
LKKAHTLPEDWKCPDVCHRWLQNVEALCMDGVYVLYGFMGGFEAAMDMRPVLQKRISIAGTTLRSRSLEYKVCLSATST